MHILKHKVVERFLPIPIFVLMLCWILTVITFDLCFNLGSLRKVRLFSYRQAMKLSDCMDYEEVFQFYLSSVSYLMKGLARSGLGLTKMKPNYHTALNLYLSNSMAFPPKEDMWKGRDDITERIWLFKRVRAMLFIECVCKEGSFEKWLPWTAEEP